MFIKRMTVLAGMTALVLSSGVMAEGSGAAVSVSALNSDIAVLQSLLKKTTLELDIAEKQDKVNQLSSGRSRGSNNRVEVLAPTDAGDSSVEVKPVYNMQADDYDDGTDSPEMEGPALIITSIEGYDNNLFAIASFNNGLNSFRLNIGDVVDREWTVHQIKTSGMVFFSRPSGLNDGTTEYSVAKLGPLYSMSQEGEDMSGEFTSTGGVVPPPPIFNAPSQADIQSFMTGSNTTN